MHEYAPVIITLVAILIGILFSRSDSRETRADLGSRLDKLDQRIDKVDQRIDRIEQRLLVIESDLRSFYAITGELKWRLDALEKRA